MENSNELVRLEEFVDNLLAKYTQMKATCADMETMLRERDTECAKLKETIVELRGERTVVGERVTGLIDRIEQWESELQAGGLSGEGDPAKLQGKLFQNGQASAK
jgi:predicted nuclease with TOPRIM domain